MTKAKRYRLEPRDVKAGYRPGPDSPIEGRDPSERVKVRGSMVWLQHAGTGLRVEGKLPDGEFTVRQIQLHEVDLRKSLFAELELKVARRLGLQK